MGCAPSCHGGMRHALGDPFHATVVPMDPYIDGWTHSRFAEVPFALRQERTPSVAAREEPPPYSEFAVDGQVTLMRGQSPVKQELEVPDRRSVMETCRGNSSFHPPSTQGHNSSMELMEEGEMAPIHASLPANFNTPEFSHPQEYNTSVLEEPIHLVGSLEHYGHPGIHRRAVFPLRCQSWSGDTAPLDVQRSWRRESYPFITTATPSNIFPPRQDAVLPLQPSYPPLPPLAPFHSPPPPPLAPVRSPPPPLTPVHSPPPPLTPVRFPPPPLAPVHSFQPPTTNIFPTHPTSPSQTFPAPQYPHTRLPPLQRHTRHHRKKVKRKRGHTWHGERPTVHMQETTVQ